MTNSRSQNIPLTPSVQQNAQPAAHTIAYKPSCRRSSHCRALRPALTLAYAAVNSCGGMTSRRYGQVYMTRRAAIDNDGASTSSSCGMQSKHHVSLGSSLRPPGNHFAKCSASQVVQGPIDSMAKGSRGGRFTFIVSNSWTARRQSQLRSHEEMRDENKNPSGTSPASNICGTVWRSGSTRCRRQRTMI